MVTIHLQKKYFNFHTVTLLLILLAGSTLSVWQFLINRSLWLDEASLALNIINRDFIELLSPLDYMQSAPILFLFIEKMTSLLFSGSEYGLRILPLVSFLFSSYLLAIILQSIYKNSLSIVFGLSLFFFNHTLLYYSSEVKQYMTDVFLQCFLLYISIVFKVPKTTKHCIALSILGVGAIFLSNVAPVILVTSGIYLLYIYIKEKNGRLPLLTIVYILWASAFIVYFSLFIHNNPHKPGMNTFWSPTFISCNPFKFYMYRSIAVDLYTLAQISGMNNKIASIVCISLFFAGITGLIRRKKIEILIAGLVPVGAHIGLVMLKLYPFDIKFVLYLLPSFLIICSSGVEYSLQRIKGNLLLFASPCIAIIVFFQLYHIGFPVKKEEIKEALLYIESNSEKTVPVYIYYGARSSFLYYSNTGFTTIAHRSVYGTIHRDDIHRYIDEIPRNQKEFWLLFSHVYKEEDLYILNNLTHAGFVREKEYKTQGASAFLIKKNELNIKNKITLTTTRQNY